MSRTFAAAWALMVVWRFPPPGLTTTLTGGRGEHTGAGVAGGVALGGDLRGDLRVALPARHPLAPRAEHCPNQAVWSYVGLPRAGFQLVSAPLQDANLFRLDAR
ncbi:MAG TPA: hypothetical protein VII06_31765 [Chloroflexota bacterium]|jgi:hypothetical protein